jgi:GNAT superfamily N-acetyltransferase
LYECGDASEPHGGLAAASIHDEWWDVEPSWQNATHSIRRARHPHRIIGNEDGYAVVFPSNGDVPQLAVRPEARRNGLGMQLLRAACAVANKPLRIINIDDRGAAVAAFLERAGATRVLRQIEMVKQL